MLRIILLVSSLVLSLPALAAIVVGNPNGSVTMVEVYDYQCMHCHKMYPVVEKLMAQNPDLKVRFMPTAILNKTSLYEAAAAVSAMQYPGKFQQFTSIVMSEPQLDKAGVDKVLKQLHLTSPKFIQGMHSKVVEGQLEEGLAFLKAEKTGTPLFIIYPSNNPKVSAVLKGEQSYQNLQKTIEAANHHG